MRTALLVIFAVTALAAAPSSDGTVGFDMRNVRLHVSDDAVLEVTWLHGRLRPLKPGQPPVFDDQRSFRLEIEDAEIAIDPASLSALVNRAFEYKGSSLSNLRVSFENGLMVQRGTLHKGLSVPFTVTASVSVTPDGLMKIHPEKVKAAGIPSTKLLDLLGVELADIIKSRPDRGVELRGNDMFIRPSKILPPPETDGRLTKVFVRGNRLVQQFGRGAASMPRTPRGNYIWFRGGTIRFGRLTMTDADLRLIDMHPADPFDFYSAKYNVQLVAGYSKNTPQGGLRTYMPDYATVANARPSTKPTKDTKGTK